jgi:UDP-glucuronate 4-epimerase
LRLIEVVPRSGEERTPPARIFNVGNHKPEDLMHVVAILEKELNLTAAKNMVPMQPGDVPETFADVDDLIREVGFRPQTSIEAGLRKFVAWYRSHYSK